MNERNINKHKYLAAFAIATLIFVFGVLLGNHISDKKISDIESLSQELQLNTLGTELQFLLISYEPCKLLNESTLSDELYSIGTKVYFMENELGETNRDVLTLKEYYHLLELRHWLLLREAQQKCNQEFDRILYFYSNEGDCDKCKVQGGVLTYLHKKYPELSIYSFDNNIDNPALQTIKELYEVEGELPILVINEKTYRGFKDRTAIEEALIAARSERAAVNSS